MSAGGQDRVIACLRYVGNVVRCQRASAIRSGVSVAVTGSWAEICEEQGDLLPNLVTGASNS